MDPASTEYIKIEKEISDIKFVLSLMMKHDSTSVPIDERKRIFDIDILVLCEYSKEMLLELLFGTKKRLNALGPGSSGKFFSVLLLQLNI